MPDRVGQQIGNYRLVRLLGSGGFAEVYLGQHVRLASKQAAIKLLHPFDTLRSQRPYLRVAEHYLGWTIIIVCNEPDLALTVRGIMQARDKLMIDIQGKRIILCDHCNHVELVQASMNARVRTRSITLY